MKDNLWIALMLMLGPIACVTKNYQATTLEHNTNCVTEIQFQGGRYNPKEYVIHIDKDIVNYLDTIRTVPGVDFVSNTGKYSGLIVIGEVFDNENVLIRINTILSCGKEIKLKID